MINSMKSGKMYHECINTVRKGQIMKTKMAVLLTTLMTATLLVGCGSPNVTESAEVTSIETITEVDATTTPEPTEAPHEHAYIEDITTEATCNTDGVKTFTCECGDSYTETITATGHIFENYISNNDATYTADGTETATCVCGETDTRTAEGSMLTYTYTEMDTTMYAQKTVNVRSMPNTDGEKLGGLSTNDEVKVTGQCIETNWYRIEYDGKVAYVSDGYLGADKVVVQAEAPATSSNIPTFTSYADVKAYAISLGYPIGSATDNGDGTAMTYWINCVQDKTYTSWDYEYETRLADLTASRDAADAILGLNNGFHMHNDKFYSKTLIANCNANHDWYVVLSKWSHNPTNCDGTRCN